MRIAQIVPQIVAGGLERVAADLSLALSARGHRVELFWLNASDPDPRLPANGIATHDCRPGRLRIPGVPHRLVRTLRTFDADLLHAHSGVWLPASVASALLRTPLLFTDHGRYLPEARKAIFVQKWCAKVTDQVVTVSTQLAEYDRDTFGLGYLPEVVDNGIDLAPFTARNPSRRAALRAEWGCADRDVVVVVSGRLVPIKNHPGLIRAFAEAAVDSMRLVFVGTGPLEEELRAQVGELGLDARVRFLGFRRDIPDCLHAADVYAMPSDSEGLPIALLEAMASGLPVVASTVGAIPQVLGDPQAGLLVPPRDTVALTNALRRLATDPALRNQLSALSRERAGGYTLERMTDRYERIYRARVRTSAPMSDRRA